MPSPYPGLRPFQEDEAHLFFGREAQIEDMLARLEERRFLAVVGTSGCGKSSLVRAGLIPALEQGFLSDALPDWRMAVMRPGSAPFDNLTTTLLSEAALGRERQSAAQAAALLQATLRRGPLGLLEAVAESHLPEGTNLLLVVDQFEELFRYRTQSKNINDTDAFVSLLLKSAQSGQSKVPIYVVITMRSDFIGDCALFTGLPETINDSQFLTPRLTRDQYREAIVEPALVGGGQLTDALVNRLLNDLGGEPDQLPVLQHALMRMWTQATDNLPARALTVHDYEAVGGLAGALSKHCDEILHNDLNTEQQCLAEVMFRALCERSSEQRDTRRPAKLGEIAAIAGVDVEAVIPVVDAFRGAGRNFLTPPFPSSLDAETTLDISHESLIRQWPTLNAWVVAEAESARQYQRLEDAAKRREQKAGAELWRGVDLQNARVWKGQEKPTEAWAARYGDAYQLAMDFLKESESEQEKQRRERERVRQHELEQARERAEEQARSASRFKAISGGIGALLLVIVGVAISAGVWYSRANDAQKVAITHQARYFSAVSHNFVETQPTLSILLSIEALKGIEAIQADFVPAAEETLRKAITKIAGKALVGHEGAVYDVAFSPDGQVLATASADQTVRLWSLSDATAEPRILRGHADRVYGVAFSPDGQLLATASADQTVRLWTLSEAAAEPRILRGHADRIHAVAFSPDGQGLATASADQTIRLWSLHDAAAEPRILRGHLGPVYGAAFSSHGELLATASADQTVRLWSLNETSGEPRILRGHTDVVHGVAFSPNDHLLATASADDTVRLWSLSNSAAEPRVLRGHGDTTYGVAFSPNGQVLATTGEDTTARLWSLEIKDLIRKGCRLTTSNFSHEDWKLYLGDQPYNRTCAEHPLHPSFVESIREQVKAGDVTGGVGKLYAALQVDGASDETLQEEARRLAAPGLVAKGEELARKGEVDKAIGAFTQALVLDPTLSLDPEAEARRLAATALVTKGEELARGGEVDKAVGAFTQALVFDPTLPLDPWAEARRLAAPALVDKGRELARQGEIRMAMADFSAAQESDANLMIDAHSWNYLCWFGSLSGIAPDVMVACEQAVVLDPDNGGNRDSRGLARALIGDYTGAAEDFHRYLEWAPKNGQPEERIRQRQDWIRMLQANQNPFSADVLEPLWEQ